VGASWRDNCAEEAARLIVVRNPRFPKYIRSAPGDKLDTGKVDIQLISDTGVAVCFNNKSSERDTENHLESDPFIHVTIIEKKRGGKKEERKSFKK